MTIRNSFAWQSFDVVALPQRVLFGRGRVAEIEREVARLDAKRAWVLSTPEQAAQAEMLVEALGGRAYGLSSGARMHTPVEATNKELRLIEEKGADVLVAFGGGSSIGLAKALALRTGLPQIAVPTTFAGSEMTPILGQTENGVKTTLRDGRLLPQTVIYDPDFVETLPPEVAGPSGMNAVAHAVEALYAEQRNPVVSMWAEAAIGALGVALPRIMANPSDRDAWTEALYGAWLAGACLGSVGMAIHHKLCHVLGGAFDLPHADVHSLLIPYSAAYNREDAPDAMGRIARALNVADAPMGLFQLMRKVARIKSLSELGLTLADIDLAASMATENPYYNPRPVDRESVRDLLRKAHRGDAPV
ncbi:maleylacetate reductase [Parvibaculum sp.]|uniref:maleylacetate reductase n=1 Tax=Parvibaculum sp. TaxID=2024848 RepID=UPI000C94228C|nr:maleylacetate reductase [Parvibaculum sp.]MAB14339.1 maleylacetate reductase [Parvibaculum sp.]